MAIWKARSSAERSESLRPEFHALHELGDRLGTQPVAAWEWIERLQDARRDAGTPRRLGRVSTPIDIADRMAQALLAHTRASRVVRVLDAGCGSGRLLAAVAREAESRGVRVACEGVEIDPIAARWAQALEPLARAGAPRALVSWTVRRADFLLAAAPAPYDLVIANPPYVAWRELDPDYRTRLRSRLGGVPSDLAALFCSALIDALRPGGRACLIVPNKLLATRYATELRSRWLIETTLEEIWDLASERVFPGCATYPVVLVIQRRKPQPKHRVVLRDAHGAVRSRWTQRSLLHLPSAVVPLGLDPELLQLVEPLWSAPRFGAKAPVACGIAVAGFGRAVGFGPDRILQSGDVGAYRLRPARRFAADQAGIPNSTRARLRTPKVLVPGMFRRLCAAYDGAGRLVGRVYFVRVEGANDVARSQRRALLLALLNSRLYALLYRGLFEGVAQSGGWLRLNAPYLEALPWPRGEPDAELVRAVARCERRRPSRDEVQRLDRAVEALFGLDPRQSAILERLAETLPPAW